jgi:HlyD family secretion protein
MVAVAILAIALYLGLSADGKSTLTIDAQRTSIAQVVESEFEEYVPIVGSVQPGTTVFLDLAEGGIVEDIYIEAGNPVSAGDLILVLSNTVAQKQNIDSETRLLENLDRLRNSKLEVTQQGLLMKEQLLDLNYQILELEKTVARYQKLRASPTVVAVTRQEFEATEDNLSYLLAKRELLEERIVQETRLRDEQSQQIDISIELVDQSLEALAEIKESLKVDAPIAGYLSSVNAEVGQSFARGQRIGQIDQLDSFKVRAEVDQYYISKVAIDQTGTFAFGGEDFELVVRKIYPEVNNDVFQIDMEFVGTPAEGLKRGQTLTIDLSLSKSSATKMLSKGGFYRYTNGRWAYRVATDGMSAERVDIVAGRQNPRFFEIFEGLNVGEWVLTSSYESYGEVDVLYFEQPLDLHSIVQTSK